MNESGFFIFLFIEISKYLILYTQHVSEITFIRYAEIRKIEKPNHLKVFGSRKKAKGPKRDSENRLRSQI